MSYTNSFTVALQGGVTVSWSQPEGTPWPGVGPASCLEQTENLTLELGAGSA